MPSTEQDPSVSSGAKWLDDLEDALTLYEIDAATYRQGRDRLVKLWEQGILEYQQVHEESDSGQLNAIRDSMNKFLARSKL